jgi:hypothetical protein
MSKSLKIGDVGCGQFGQNAYVRNILSFPDAVLYEEIKRAIRETAEDDAIVAYYGHVLYDGSK